MAKVGDKIRIISMEGEPNYTGKEGVVEFIYSMVTYWNMAWC